MTKGKCGFTWDRLARPKVPHWNFSDRSWGESKTPRIKAFFSRIEISARVFRLISLTKNLAMVSSCYSCIPPNMALVYANHRLRNIMNGPNLAETKQRSSLQIQDLTNAIPP